MAPYIWNSLATLVSANVAIGGGDSGTCVSALKATNTFGLRGGEQGGHGRAEIAHIDQRDARVLELRDRKVAALHEPEELQLIWERVQDVFDLPNDPQVIENDYLIDFDHPVLGPTKWHQTPLTYNKTPLSTRKMAPAHGENTEEILVDLLDYTWEDIETLHDEGVIL